MPPKEIEMLSTDLQRAIFDNDLALVTQHIDDPAAHTSEKQREKLSKALGMKVEPYYEETTILVMLAIFYGKFEIFDLMLKKHGERDFHKAYQLIGGNGTVRMLERLRIYDPIAMMRQAAKHGRKLIIRTILDKYPECAVEEVICEAIKYKHVEVSLFLLLRVDNISTYLSIIESFDDSDLLRRLHQDAFDFGNLIDRVRHANVSEAWECLIFYLGTFDVEFESLDDLFSVFFSMPSKFHGMFDEYVNTPEKATELMHYLTYEFEMFDPDYSVKPFVEKYKYLLSKGGDMMAKRDPNGYRVTRFTRRSDDGEDAEIAQELSCLERVSKDCIGGRILRVLVPHIKDAKTWSDILTLRINESHAREPIYDIVLFARNASDEVKADPDWKMYFTPMFERVATASNVFCNHERFVTETLALGPEVNPELLLYCEAPVMEILIRDAGLVPTPWKYGENTFEAPEHWGRTTVYSKDVEEIRALWARGEHPVQMNPETPQVMV